MKFAYIFLLLPVFSLAQQKNDNAVIVHNLTFDSAVSKLVEMGYQIRVNDKKQKTCITQVSVSNLSIYVRENKDGEIIISSEFETSYFSSGSAGKIRVAYFKHGVMHDRWEEMMKDAGQFPDREYKIVK